MPKVNVYLPQDLADWAKAVGVSISSITQDALRQQRLLFEQAQLVAADRAAGEVDETEVERWRQRLARSSSMPPF